MDKSLGVSNSGKTCSVFSNPKLHISAIAIVLDKASGISANKFAISSELLKYCSGV